MPEHTVLIALTGTTTGVVGYLTFEASANQSVTGILPSDRHIPKYLFYYLKSIRPKVLHDAYGGAQPHISQGYVKELEIPLPPLDQQKKIAAILDAADAYRQKTKTLITKYEELTQSLFLEMFGDDTGTLTELGKVIKTVGGGTPSKDNEQYWNGNIPWASVKDLKSDRLTKTQDFITQSGVDNSATRVVPNGSLIVATRMAVGRAVICEMDVAINQDLKAIQTTGKINITYLLYLFKSKKNYFDSVSSGATVKGIKIEHITKLKVNLPNYSKQNQFAERVQAIQVQKTQAQASLVQAEDLFNSLLQRAFKGELS
jgi:type I restriction enzyme S subunit